jgi:hypothetical protein
MCCHPVNAHVRTKVESPGDIECDNFRRICLVSFYHTSYERCILTLSCARSKQAKCHEVVIVGLLNREESFCFKGDVDGQQKCRQGCVVAIAVVAFVFMLNLPSSVMVRFLIPWCIYVLLSKGVTVLKVA